MQGNKIAPKPEKANVLPAEGTSFSKTSSCRVNQSLNWLLVILVIFLLGTTAFFAYSYYELKQQDNVQQPTPTTPPPKSILPSLDPELSPTSTPNLTADWQIYRGEGFELRYPKDWYLLEIPGPVTKFSNKETGEEGSLLVSVFTNTDVNTNSLDSIKKYYEDDPEKFAILGDITVDGRPGFEVEFLDRFQRETIIAGDYNEVPKSIFTFFVNYPESQKNEAINMYLKILSTFKFTE